MDWNEEESHFFSDLLLKSALEYEIQQSNYVI